MCSVEAGWRQPHLEVFWTELVAVQVNGRQENGLHLVVPQLIGGEVGGNQDLQGEGTRGRGEPVLQGRSQGRAQWVRLGMVA